MLTEHTIQIVKSTAPILQAHGETLTTHFYKRMFEHNPEVAPFFNPAHQSAGKQQRALANAITAYAANIDNLEVLGSAVELIAQKHASLMIKPEHYPIVGANLLASIQEVLGEGATDEIINAWAEAYGFLADILIKREQQIYEVNAKQPGGWEGFQNLRVIRKEKESTNITSFYLASVNNTPLPSFQAGQYITVRVNAPEKTSTMRNYSLSDKAGQDYFRISVKREEAPKANTPAGRVSNWLHDHVEVGDLLEIAPPCGEFVLNATPNNRPLVLLAGGVGITPIMSMLLTALETMPERKILVVHACLNDSVQAFKPTLDALEKTHPQLTIHHRYSESGPLTTNSSTGLVTTELLDALLPQRDCDYYFCGPHPFMNTIHHNLRQWGIPSHQIRYESFGPQQALGQVA